LLNPSVLNSLERNTCKAQSGTAQRPVASIEFAGENLATGPLHLLWNSSCELCGERGYHASVLQASELFHESQLGYTRRRGGWEATPVVIAFERPSKLEVRKGGCGHAERNMNSGPSWRVEMQQYSFSVTDLTNFDSSAGSFQLTEDEVVEFGREYAARLLDEQPEIRHQGLCIVAFDAAGHARFIQPIDTVH
jgi:hypothetical protein